MADLTRFYDFLDLTDEQKGELQKYQAEQFKQNEELRLESRKLFFELRQMALEKNPKEELIQKKIERSEEHTSELQSRPHLVCRLLLEKKKTMITDEVILDITECS